IAVDLPVMTSGEEQLHFPVDIRTEGLDKIIGEAERIVAPLVKHTKAWMQSGADQGTGAGGTHDCITVVQKTVGRRTEAITPETAPQQCRPVTLRSLSFQILGIARPDPTRQAAQAFILAGECRQNGRLLRYLRHYQRLPDALLQRRAGIGLR